MAITELDIGGAEKAFVRIACGLRSLGWDVETISLRDRGPLASSLDQAGIPVHALNCRGFIDPRSVFRLHRHLSARRPNALLTFLHQANIAGRIAGHWAGIPLIVSGVRVADRRLSVSISERMTACCVDHYVAVSQSVARTHCDLCGIPDNKMTVIYNGVDGAEIEQVPATAKESLGIPEDHQVILFAGRLTEQKAPLDLLQAFASLEEAFLSNTTLMFVGDGPLRSTLQHQISRRNLQHNVRLTGWRPDLIGIMKLADVLVLPSHWEGLPNVVLEAFAAGLPVIASDVDGVRELLSGTARRDADQPLTDEPSHAAVGRLYPPGDLNALRIAIQDQLHAAGKQNPNWHIAQPVIREQFTWPSAVASYDRLLTERLPMQAPDPRH